jgi:hypothetical protein
MLFAIIQAASAYERADAAIKFSDAQSRAVQSKSSE